MRLRGGGPPPEDTELVLAAGGRIKQTIIRDTSSKTDWDETRSIIFSVQILNSERYQAVTGRTPPKTPITAQTYRRHGLPYFAIYGEEPSGIRGDFSAVKSVNTIDKTMNTIKAKQAVAEVSNSINSPVILLAPTGKRMSEKDLSNTAEKARTEASESSQEAPVFDGIINRALTTIMPFRHISDIEASIAKYRGF
jgi:hypothetical protein